MMKYLFAILMLSIYGVMPVHAESKNEKALLDAIDARDGSAKAIQKLLKSKSKIIFNYHAIMNVGLVDDKVVCESLRRNLVYKKVRPFVLQGLRNCKTDTVRDSFRKIITGPEYTLIDKYIAVSNLGYIAEKLDWPYLEQAYNDNPNTDVIFSLMQAIAYEGSHVSDFKVLNWEQLSTSIQVRQIQRAALYLVNRIKGIDQKISYFNAKMAYAVAQKNQDGDAQIQAIRLLGNYDEAKPMFISMLGGINTCEIGELSSPSSLYMRRRLAVLQFASKWTDDAWLSAMNAVLNSKCTIAAAQAIASIRRHKLPIDVMAVKSHENAGIAMQAYQTIFSRKPEMVIDDLAAMVKGKNYFKAWKAIDILSSSDDGKDVIAKALPFSQFSILKDDATYILNPAKVIKATKRRLTPDRIGRKEKVYLELDTTRGPISIVLYSGNNAAAQFRDLVASEGLNEMVWHRVIPNFVAQAGQTTNKVSADWGSIRDEFSGNKNDQHLVGTVGLATSGKDTGGSQFFINLNYNQHLDGRYTVFGRVTGGLDIAFALTEGDIIKSAKVVSK